MKRNLKKLESENYDVLVVGGGIHGAAILQEASLAGYKTALIEKSDFCSATSANSLKIMHGGLRYLQQLNFFRMRNSIRSRNIMMRIDPDNVKSLGFLMPLYGWGLGGKEIMKTALTINDWISLDRNTGLGKENHLPKGKIIPARECQAIIPDVQKKGLRGAGIWYDAIARDTEHLGISFIKQAVSYGASVANYLEAVDINIENNQIKSIKVIDAISGNKFNIKSKCVVNATGPWVKDIQDLAHSCSIEEPKWVSGINIVVNKKIFPDYAVCLQGNDRYLANRRFSGKGKRSYFFVPWQGQTMVGTFYKGYNGHPDNFKIKKKDIVEFIDQINKISKQSEIKLANISFYHGGLLPAKSVKNNGIYQLENKTTVINHDIPHGLISIKSIKYTTAPTVAQKVLNDVIKNIGKKKEIKKQKKRYLKKERAINLPLTVNDIAYFIEDEMAYRLSDIIFRRTEIGAIGCPSMDVLENIAKIMAENMGWSDKKQANEINNVLDYYSPVQNKFL